MPERKAVIHYIDYYPEEVCDTIQEMLATVCPSECKSCQWKHLCTDALAQEA